MLPQGKRAAGKEVFVLAAYRKGTPSELESRLRP